MEGSSKKVRELEKTKRYRKKKMREETRKIGWGNIYLLFVHMFKDKLRIQGSKISQQQLLKFLDVVEVICPWFSEEGSIYFKT